MGTPCKNNWPLNGRKAVNCARQCFGRHLQRNQIGKQRYGICLRITQSEVKKESKKSAVTADTRPDKYTQ